MRAIPALPIELLELDFGCIVSIPERRQRPLVRLESLCGQGAVKRGILRPQLGHLDALVLTQRQLSAPLALPLTLLPLQLRLLLQDADTRLELRLQPQRLLAFSRQLRVELHTCALSVNREALSLCKLLA